MSSDPRKGCLLAKRPLRWRQQHNSQPEPLERQQRDYTYSTRGDVDAFVKFFTGGSR